MEFSAGMTPLNISVNIISIHKIYCQITRCRLTYKKGSSLHFSAPAVERSNSQIIPIHRPLFPGASGSPWHADECTRQAHSVIALRSLCAVKAGTFQRPLIKKCSQFPTPVFPFLTPGPHHKARRVL